MIFSLGLSGCDAQKQPVRIIFEIYVFICYPQYVHDVCVHTHRNSLFTENIPETLCPLEAIASHELLRLVNFLKTEINEPL